MVRYPLPYYPPRYDHAPPGTPGRYGAATTSAAYPPPARPFVTPFVEERRDYTGHFIRGLVAGACLSAVRHGLQHGGLGADGRTVARQALQEGTALAAGARAAVAVAERDFATAALSASAGLAGVYLIERLLGPATPEGRTAQATWAADDNANATEIEG
ncbi:hypothetical protein [Halorhodospira abdelmalekii]|uniref:hypothetical protein n=1 Tax=Halorhodospira abdelmalekii TaxID=421629 RepID=UPI00190591E4|nr:hypothetical protein [Halorhodospira abdelmalekii]